MGTIKTTNIETITGSGTLTLGQSGETISVPSGATLTVPSGGLSGQNYPAFFASLSADQTGISDGATVKVQFNNEAFDTDNMYDNSTNYRITIPSGKAGKYYIESSVFVDSLATSNLTRGIIYIYKNGSVNVQSFRDYRNSYTQKNNIQVSAIMDLAVGDYIEIFAFCNSVNSGNLQIRGDTSVSESWFQGFRIGD
jgi:hypothetical protein